MRVHIIHAKYVGLASFEPRNCPSSVQFVARRLSDKLSASRVFDHTVVEATQTKMGFYVIRTPEAQADRTRSCDRNGRPHGYNCCCCWLFTLLSQVSTSSCVCVSFCRLPTTTAEILHARQLRVRSNSQRRRGGSHDPFLDPIQHEKVRPNYF